MKLTSKGTTIVVKIRARVSLLRPEYGNNTMERCIFEFGKVPASVIMYAFGQASKEDVDDMVRQGYATK